MTGSNSQAPHFEPLHEAHALEQVAFVLQFDPPIDDLTYAVVRKAAEAFKELPGRSEIQGFRFGLGTGTQLPSVANGNAFHRSRLDGTIEDELRLDRISITYRTMNYT